MIGLFMLSLLGSILLWQGTFAIPNATAIPIGNGSCIAWPDFWDVSFPIRVDLSGEIWIVVDQADDPDANGLYVKPRNFSEPDFDFRDWVVSSNQVSTDLAKINLVVDFRSTRHTLRRPLNIFRCFDGTLHLNPMSPTYEVSVSRNTGIMTLDTGYKLEPYAHEVNGVRQNGTFLGALNHTTWGFNYVRPQVCGALDYYEARLQGLPPDHNSERSSTAAPEFFGFLKLKP
jgi:hypothetical protein